MLKPKCKECGKSDKVVVAIYGKVVGLNDRYVVGLNDRYYECERCYTVVKRISKFKLN